LRRRDTHAGERVSVQGVRHGSDVRGRLASTAQRSDRTRAYSTAGDRVFWFGMDGGHGDRFGCSRVLCFEELRGACFLFCFF
jgi:hypothetical protein